MTESTTIELDPERGWYAVPEDRDDVAGWADWLVRQLAGPDADDGAVERAVAEVTVHALASHDAAIELTWLFVPSPLEPVLAVCDLELVFGTVGDLPGLAEIRASLAARQPEHLGEPEVSTVALPCGDAVRQHVMTTDDGGGVVEGVTHVVTVEGLDDALLRMRTTWRSVALGEVLVPEADRMAAALVVRTD
jgi:hypothetical protein